MALCHDSSFLAKAHLTRPVQDEIDFFLLLVVPGHLSAMRFKRDMSKREVLWLNRAGAPGNVLRPTPRGIGAALDS